MEKGYLILETGEVFPGVLTGSDKNVVGEVVFNTSMTGYQEIMTDPSYAGQIIVFCYPLIGNYGVNEDDNESQHTFVRGIITSELCTEPSHYKSKYAAGSILNDNGIPCLSEVDTRELVKTIRKYGTVNGMITNKMVEKIPNVPSSFLVKQVASKKMKTYQNDGPHVLLMDYGYKKSILDYLLHYQCKVTVVPFDTPFAEIKALNPDGIVLSNGPGDPMSLERYLPDIKNICDNYVTLGICLGHQLIGLSYGAKTKKLPFGHRGGNHPVKDVSTGKVFITSQNHGYVVVENSIDRDILTTAFRHVNDGTVEGLQHKTLPITTVQFHPEAHPGPQDTEYIFENFIHQIKEHTGVLTYAINY